MLYKPLTFDIDIINRGIQYSYSEINVTDGLVSSLINATSFDIHFQASYLDWTNSARYELSVNKIIGEMRSLEVILKNKFKIMESNSLDDFSYNTINPDLLV